MTRDAMAVLTGIKIIEDSSMLVWSMAPYPRSTARAKRRAARGFPQHMRWSAVPSEEVFYIKGERAAVMHPEMARRLRAELVEKRERRLSPFAAWSGGLCGMAIT